MSKTNSPSQAKRALRLTAQRKLELYLATRPPEAPLGELVRQYGVHLDDLRHIEQAVESAALAALKAQGRHGRLPRDVSPARVLQLEQELREKVLSLDFNLNLLGFRPRITHLPCSFQRMSNPITPGQALQGIHCRI